jgi:hypothetical protein
MNGDNQRRSFRISVADEQRGARLRVEDKDYRVVLEDESAGGFAVLADGQLLLKAGQELQLHTAAGWSIVRVAHSSCLGAHTRIGFVRVADLPDAKTLRGTRSTWWTYLVPGGDQPGIAWSVTCATLLVVCIGAYWLWQYFGAAPKYHHSGPLAAEESGARFFQFFSTDFQKRWKAAQETGAQINLSSEQQTKISAILFQAEQEILQLRSARRRDRQAEQERLHTAEDQILSVLNKKQKAQWERLADAPAEQP